MRSLLILSYLLQTLSSLGQDVNSEEKFPFQVLYAYGAKNRDGLTLKSLDLISIDDALTISEDGTLSLIHYTGFPIEVNGDTTIVVKDLQNLIVIPTKDTNGKITYSPRPNLPYLFIADAILARKNKISFSGYCSHRGDGLKILYPPNYNKSILEYKDDLFLRWTPSSSMFYPIEFKTMFEEKLGSVKANTNELFLKREDVNNIKGEQDIFVVVVQENVGGSKFSISVAVKPFSKNSLEFPYPNKLKKATFALMAGLYVETLSSSYFEEAEKYFLLAAELSDKSFYKEMLANFRKRTER